MTPEYNVNRREPPASGLEGIFWFCIITAVVAFFFDKLRDPLPRDSMAEMEQAEADAWQERARGNVKVGTVIDMGQTCTTNTLVCALDTSNTPVVIGQETNSTPEAQP